MTVNDTDKFLVNRSTSSYQIEAQDLMAELQDTDLMLVNRGGISYKATGAEIKDSLQPPSIAPEIESVVLTDLDTSGNRFTSEQFLTTVTMAEEGEPVATKTIDAYVEGDIFTLGQFNEPLESTSVVPGSWNAVLGTASTYWQSVTYGDDKFVAVSNTGPDHVMYSTDGISWTSASATASMFWYSVAYGDGKFVAVAYSGTGTRAMYSTDGINWTSGVIAGPANQWRSVTYGNGKFVAVSTRSSGQDVMYSTDGINWTRASAAATYDWNGVTYGDGKFVAITSTSASDQVMYSTDGINWTSANSPESNNWRAITYGDGKFVAVGRSGTNRVMWSTDGINWTSASAAEDNDWYGVTYGDNKFVAVSDSGTNRVMWSTDAINWTSAQAAEANDWQDVTYGDDKFVAVAQTGTNRVMWSYTGTNEDGGTLVFADGADMSLLASGDTVNQDSTTGTVGSITDTTVALATSTGGWIDGVDVTGPEKQLILANAKKYLEFDQAGNVTDLLDAPQSPAANIDDTFTLTFPATFPSGNTPDEELGDGTTLTTCVTASNPSGTSGPVCDTVQPAVSIIQFNEPLESTGVTPDGWTLLPKIDTSPWQSVTYAEGKFVAVASSGTHNVMYSTDGINWTPVDIGFSKSWQSVAYGNGMFVAVGGTSSDGYTMYSTDGALTWTEVALTSSRRNYWHSVTYADGKFVAVASTGTRRVMYSTDAISWSVAYAAEDNNWESVTYAEGKFVAVARSGTNRVMWSTDAINWTSASGSGSLQWYGITYGDGKFVAVAYSGTGDKVMYSTDGALTWTSAPSAPADNLWSSVTYADGKFVAVGRSGDATKLSMYSTDGINWTPTSTPASSVWYDTTYGDGKFVAVGDAGNTMWSYTGTDELATLIFADGTDMSPLASGDTVNQDLTTGTAILIEDTTVTLSSSPGGWVTAANGGANVIGPDKTPIRSLTQEEFDNQALKFATYSNRKDVFGGETATAERDALIQNLVDQGYSLEDVLELL